MEGRRGGVRFHIKYLVRFTFIFGKIAKSHSNERHSKGAKTSAISGSQAMQLRRSPNGFVSLRNCRHTVSRMEYFRFACDCIE